jgi:hypothetical protein
MKRLVVLASLLALPALCGSAAGGTPPRSTLVAFVCQRALDPPGRSVSVKAVMRPLAGTVQLSVKFELLERVAGSASAKSVLGAGDLGVFLTPADPTLGRRPGDVWGVNKTVYNLDAPAQYRFRVTFRWIGAHGKVLGTAVKLSDSCIQKELRPDLLVKRVNVSPIPRRPHDERYTAVIANRGGSAAGPFQVLFTPGDGSASQSVTVQRLGAHSSLRESFVGPPCDAVSPPTVVADSTGQVDDYDRDNNALTVACPSA